MVTGATTNEKPYPNKIAATVRHILDWSQRGRACMRRSLTLPTHSANEKAAVQPIIAALLRALSQIGNGINGNTEEHGEDADREQGVAVAAAPPPAGADAASQHDDGEDEAVDINSDETTAQRVLVRSDIRKERCMPRNAGQGAKRFVDFEVNELMAFNPYLLPHETSVLVVAKNIMRGGKRRRQHTGRP